MTTPRLPYTVRPLGPWAEPVTDPRRRSPFYAKWKSTMDLIDREVWALGARAWVLQVDVPARSIMRDGTLRALAQPASPAIRVSLDSRHGPLTYACDRYLDWQANVRAVALTLEALRAVSRHGAAGRDQQYRGWTAIAARPHEMTREQAAELVARCSGTGATGALTAVELLADPDALQRAYRAAAKRTHPDRDGGDAETFALLTAARGLLGIEAP